MGEDPIAEAFVRQAAACDATGSPLYGAVCRRLGAAPGLLGPVEVDVGHHPIRVLGALHYLALTDGIDPWVDPVGTVEEHRDWVEDFITTRRVQTNEVQRSWALLPAFLSFGAPRIELLELGSSAGLNLVWDRYRYRYAAGTWGDTSAALELSGEERSPVPAALLSREVRVGRRRGVEIESVDATSEDGRNLLRCFVWADQPERLERLDQALHALADDPPELIRGDYVELLPELLDDRIDDALLVVFQTASTQYLSPEQNSSLLRALKSSRSPVAWISTRRHDEEETSFSGGYELELALFPAQAPTMIARLGYHGQWLDWCAAAA